MSNKNDKVDAIILPMCMYGALVCEENAEMLKNIGNSMDELLKDQKFFEILDEFLGRLNEFLNQKFPEEKNKFILFMPYFFPVESEKVSRKIKDFVETFSEEVVKNEKFVN